MSTRLKIGLFNCDGTRGTIEQPCSFSRYQYDNRAIDCKAAEILGVNPLVPLENIYRGRRPNWCPFTQYPSCLCRERETDDARINSIETILSES